ncbi:hypothetical protein FACS189490_05240 [Clostridia bacterium]|nr:hypothetical protein FACS189490_05240 [Clostridia bacterium]
MRYVKDKPKYEYYTCTTYQRGRHHFEENCSRHGISRKDIEKLLLAKIQETIADVNADKKAFAARIQQLSNKELEKEIKSKTAEIGKSERRIAELDRIIKRIYEDHIAEKLSDERFGKMLTDYEGEQTTLTASLERLRGDVGSMNTKTASVESFLKLVEKQSSVMELTPEIARMFIQKILVHEPTYTTPKKRIKASQQVDIYFNHIGLYEN